VPAYTIEAVLIQLQSFLFEDLPEDIEKLKSILIGESIKKANDFICSQCKHKGPIQPYPPFPKNEQVAEDYIMLKSPKDLLREELVCFQTKMDLKDGTLGIGISIRKSPRTGLIQHVNPTIDLINMRSFTKLKVRKSLDGARFSHWLPLYFGETEEFEVSEEHYDEGLDEMVSKKRLVNTLRRFETHVEKSVRFLVTGSTRKELSPEHILEFMPKLINTHVLDLMKENRHISILAIRRLFNFIRLFAYFMNKDPRIQEQMEGRVKRFIDDPEQRTKKNTPNLGDLQVFSTMSRQFSHADMIKAYVDEQLDRNVMWMLIKIPELDFENKKLNKRNASKTTESERIKICFESSKTGLYFTAFFVHLNACVEKFTGQKPKNFAELARVLDQNHGCLPTEAENHFQQALFSISKIEDFKSYFNLIGYEVNSEKETYDKLIAAVKNSRQKGYHGRDDRSAIRQKEVEVVADMSESRLLKLVTQFCDAKIEREEFKPDDAESVASAQEVRVKNHIKGLTLKKEMAGANAEPLWKELCLKNFDFVRQALQSNKLERADAAFFAQKHDEEEILKFSMTETEMKVREDNLIVDLTKARGSLDTFNMRYATDYADYNAESFSYRKLVVKLALEQIIMDIQHNQSFELAFEFIKLFGGEIENLKVKIIDKTSLKSNHYWLLALIPKLKALKTLKLYNDAQGISFDKNGFKFLSKALAYLQKNGGSLSKLQLNQVVNHGNSGENLFQCLKFLPSLQVLDFSFNRLSNNDCRGIGKVLSDFKLIRELNLSNTHIDNASAKDIADGLMRAKQIEIVKFRGNCTHDLN